MLFNKYQKISYNIGGKEFEACDIFTRVTFLQNYSSSKAYDTYYIQENETPEDVANKVYGNMYYSWLILLVNDIIEDDEWYRGDNHFTDLMTKNYGGESFYIYNLPNIQQGDLMIKVTSTSGNEVTEVDSTVYRIINDFDKDFRSVWGRSGQGTFNSGDKIMFARRNPNNGIVEPISFASSDDPDVSTQFAVLQYTEQKKNSPVYFINSLNVVVPTNVVYSGSPTPTVQKTSVNYNTVYTNSGDNTTEQNFAKTLLYYYMENSGTFPNLSKLTYNQVEYNKYIARRTIKILKPEYLQTTVDLISRLVRTNEIGRRIAIGF